jgi:hypothetical protein
MTDHLPVAPTPLQHGAYFIPCKEKQGFPVNNIKCNRFHYYSLIFDALAIRRRQSRLGKAGTRPYYMAEKKKIGA